MSNVEFVCRVVDLAQTGKSFSSRSWSGMAILSVEMGVAAASRSHAKTTIRQTMGQELLRAVLKVAMLDGGSRLPAPRLALGLGGGFR